MENRAIAIILARGGSKGIPGKNLRKVGGVSLVARSVLAAGDARSVETVYVSTDDGAIAEEARRYGAQIVWRPEEIAGDTASSESGWLHVLETLRTSGRPVPENLVFLQCTSPFTEGPHIDDCVAEMVRRGADCALSVTEDHSFLWRGDENGFGRGVNHDERGQRARRQDLEPTYKENGAIYVVRRTAFEAKRNRFCGKVAISVVDQPPIEIDSLGDLAICDAIARTNQRPDVPPPHLLAKVVDIKAVIMDFDGVHTDDRVMVDETGRESVVVSRRDGMGIERLRKLGRYKLVIVSKETNAVVHTRARKLGIECYNQIEDKERTIAAWLAENEQDWRNVLYIGNDINDIRPLQLSGIAVCPQDAHREVLPLADWVVPVDGGYGVVRAVSDFLLRTAQG